jgi:hypothetical protein
LDQGHTHDDVVRILVGGVECSLIIYLLHAAFFVIDCIFILVSTSSAQFVNPAA